MQTEATFWGRLVRAEGSELLRLRGARFGGPGGESARRFRCATLVLLALLASPAVSMAAEPTPDPHPTAKAPARAGTPTPDPTPAARDAATTPAAPTPAPTPAASQGPSTSSPSTPVQSAPTTPEPSTTAQHPTTPRPKPRSKAPAAQKPQRGSRPVERIAPPSRAIPDQVERAAAAAAAATAAAATPATTPDGSKLLLGALGLLTLVLASGSLLVLLARAGGWEARA